MYLHHPSLVFIPMLVLATLAVCLGLVTRQEHRYSMACWGAAFAGMCAVGVLCTLNQQTNDGFFVALANVLLSGAFSLMLGGVYRLQGNKPVRLWAWWPVLVIGALFAVLPSQSALRSALLLTLLGFQIALLGWTIAQQWHAAGKGECFLLVGVSLAMASLLTYAGSAWAGPWGFPFSSASAPVIFSLACVAMVVSSFGFLVMLKERAEACHIALAFTDDLTGLYNRRYVRHALEQQIVQARRRPQPLSLLLVDVDFFKHINDAHGHLCGDQVLQELAACLKAQLRAGDIVGRWGGEEFMVILPHTDAAGAKALAERVRTAVQKNRFVISDDKVHSITVSVGLHSLNCGVLTDGKNMVAAADKALYLAKGSGRNCVATM